MSLQHMEIGGLSFERYGQGLAARKPILHGEVHGRGPIEDPVPPTTSLEALKEGAGSALSAWRDIEASYGIVGSPFPNKGTGTPDQVEPMIRSAPAPVMQTAESYVPPAAGLRYSDGSPMQVGDVVVLDEVLYEVKGRDFAGGIIVEGPGVGTRTVPMVALGQCRVLKRKV